jgi:RNA polymerase sigma factor (sigma-70 family)
MNNLTKLFIAEREKLLRAALKIVKTMHQAEEIIQDAYFKISSVSQKEEIKNQRSFCYRVVRNLAIDWHRRKKLEDTIFSADTVLGTCEMNSSTLEHDASNTQKLSIIIKTIKKLPDRTQKAFEMHYYHGMTQREIAGSFGISAAMVNFMIKEAREELVSNQQALVG